MLKRYHVVQEFNKGVYDYIMRRMKVAVSRMKKDSRDSGTEDQPVEEEDCTSQQIFMRLPYSFRSFRLVISTQRDSEEDNAPGPSRRKRKRAPTPPPANVKTGPHKKSRELSPTRNTASHVGLPRRRLYPQLRPPVLISCIYAPRGSHRARRAQRDRTFLRASVL